MPEQEGSGRIQQDCDYNRNGKMEDYADIKDDPLFLAVPLPFGVTHEALGSRRHAGIEKSQHGNHAGHHAENAEVVHPQGIQDQARRVQGNEHRNAHFHIQKTCISDYSGDGIHGTA